MSHRPGSTAPRVVVVGGGVIGLSCAYYLARGGADVVLLERQRIGAGASSGNAGTVSAGHPPLNRPGRISAGLRQMLDPTSPLYVRPRWDPALWQWLARFARYCTDDHVERAMGVMAPLGKDALLLFETLLREERIECDYRGEGYYDVCSTEEGLENARHEAEIIERYGYHPEYLDREELRRREPALAPGVIGGVFYPEAATLRPSLFLERLAGVCRKLGVEIREGEEVVGIEVIGGRVSGVQTRSLDVTEKRGIDGYVGAGPRVRRGTESTASELEAADCVILANGPWAVALASQVDVRLPVQPGKGYHRDIEIGPNGAPSLRVACVLNETSVFCTPMDTYVRFAGTMEFSGMNHVLRPERLRQLSQAAREAFPGLGSARPNSQWVGLRPMSVDGLPIVGPLGGLDGLFVATGHGMLGLTLGPVTGEIVANLVLAGDDDRAGPLAPSRFD